MNLYFSTEESFQLVLEVYKDDANYIIEEHAKTINLIQKVRKCTLEESISFIVNSPKISVDNLIKYQATFFIMKKQQHEINKLDTTIEQYKTQISYLSTGNYSASDRAELTKYYQSKIAELEQKKTARINNLKVKGATVISPGKSSGHSTHR